MPHAIPKEYDALVARYLPLPAHPRLFATRDMLATLRARFEHPDLKPFADRLVEASQQEPSIAGAEACAYLYLLYGDAAQARAAHDKAMALATAPFDPQKQDVSRDIGRNILGLAMVYDWCYDFFTGEERHYLIGRMKQYAAAMECGYPPENQGAVTGHSGEAMLLRDLLGAGIAVFDEDEEIYRLTLGRILKDFVPARDFLYRAGRHYQGNDYGNYRFTFDLFLVWILQRMGFESPFASMQDVSRVGYQFLYARRPDGQLMRYGDIYSSNKRKFGEYWPVSGLAEMALFGDAHFNGEFFLQAQDRMPGRAEVIFPLLFVDPDAPRSDCADLPLTVMYHFPTSGMVARTGWDSGINPDSRVAVCTVDMPEYKTNNHQHLDAGAFSLYYKGGLAIDSGLYEGRDTHYGTAHDINYNKRTIAHNCLTVYDPDEKFTIYDRATQNDGGQFPPYHSYEVRDKEQLLSQPQQAGVLCRATLPHARAPRFSLIWGDLAASYSRKVEGYQRAAVFINRGEEGCPAALVVMDWVRAQRAEYTKKWLLHTMEQPRIENNTIVADRTDWRYKGRLVATCLLPEDAQMEAIGGEEREFEVDGVCFPAHGYGDEYSQEGGAWRVEVRPGTPRQEDTFLHVLQVQDADNTLAPLTAAKVEQPGIVGAVIGCDMVLFNTYHGPRRDVTLEVPDGVKWLFFAGLEDAFYRLENDGKSQVIRVEAGECAICSRVVPGKLVLRAEKDDFF
nr:heparinase II/III family protein [bacterium]